MIVDFVIAFYLGGAVATAAAVWSATGLERRRNPKTRMRLDSQIVWVVIAWPISAVVCRLYVDSGRLD